MEVYKVSVFHFSDSVYMSCLKVSWELYCCSVSLLVPPMFRRDVHSIRGTQTFDFYFKYSRFLSCKRIM